MFDLKGKVAVITGSSRGIGKATAEYLARAGAKVIVSSRKEESCLPVVEGIKAEGGEAHAIACNVAYKEQVEHLVYETEKVYGPIDILICNAACNPVYGPMHTVSDDAFDKIINTNVKSNFWLSNLVAPSMAKRGGGSIIIVSSIAGLMGTTGIGVYGISKAADMQLARNLAMEWGPKNIRANCICPGLVKTDFAKALWENKDALNKVINATPLRRVGEPDDIAGVALFLASDESRFVTGQYIIADGGGTITDHM